MSEHDPRHGALLRRWGAVVARRARTVVVVWAVLIVGGFAVALGALGTPSLFDRLDSGEIVVDGENQAGRDLLATGGGSGFSTYTQTLTGVDLGDPAVATAAATAVQDLTGIEHVESAVNPFVVPEGPTSPAALRLTLDGDPASGGFATVVTFDADNTAEEEDAATAAVDEVFDRLAEQTGASGDQRGGLRGLVDRIVEQVKIDGQRGEGIALPVSFAVMVVVFGGFLAAGLPGHRRGGVDRGRARHPARLLLPARPRRHRRQRGHGARRSACASTTGCSSVCRFREELRGCCRAPRSTSSPTPRSSTRPPRPWTGPAAPSSSRRSPWRSRWPA